MRSGRLGCALFNCLGMVPSYHAEFGLKILSSQKWLVFFGRFSEESPRSRVSIFSGSKIWWWRSRGTKKPFRWWFSNMFFLFSAQPGDMIQVDVCIFFKWVETRHHHLVIYCLQREFFRTSAEQWKKPGCLWYVGDYTTQFCGDYNKPW